MSYSVQDLLGQIAAYHESLPLPVERPALPEFAFSPRAPRVERLPAARSGIAPHEGPMAPPKPYVTGGPVEGLGKDEKTWRQMGTVFPAPVNEHTKPPAGTAPTLEGLQRYLKRMDDYEAEWRAIAATQSLELPTVGQELAATGISSVSLQSSSDEDDAFEASDEDVERNACRYGTAYTAVELAPLARRIEWERFAVACSPTQKVWITVREDGTMGVKTDSARLTADDLRPLARRLKAALDGRTAADLLNDRARAAFYGVVGSVLYGVRSGEHTPEQSFDILGAEEHEDDESNGGPQMLGLHQFSLDGILEGITNPYTGLPVSYGPVEYEGDDDEETQPEYPEDPDPSWLPDGF